MLKLKTKKNCALFLAFIIFIAIILSIKIINNNNILTELHLSDKGSFESETSDSKDTGNPFRLTIYDQDIDSDYYKDKWNLDLDSNENNFVYKEGLAMNGKKIVAGTWNRDTDGDYKLYINGKIYAYIIEKPNNWGFIKRASDYVLVFATTDEKYNMNKLDLNQLWYYSKLED